MADWTDNPFATSASDSPFADPSVTNAAAAVPEYNPFENVPVTSAPAPVKAAPAKPPPPAHLPQHTAPPAQAAQAQPAATPSWAQPTAAPAQAKAKPAVAQQQPAAVVAAPPPVDPAQQKEYDARAAVTSQDMTNYQRTPNFPPIPMVLRKGFLKPCFHVNIEAEIPVYGQLIARHGMFVWALYSFTLLFNFFCVLAGLACDGCDGTSVSCALSAGYLLVFPMCSYCAWYHPLYNGIRTDSSLKFGLFFLVVSFQFIFSCIMAVGFPSVGGAGIWFASKTVDSNKAAGILQFVCAIIWILNCVAQFYLLTKTLKFYRSTGGSIEKAQNEAIVGVASNKAVQQAALQGAKQAAVGAASTNWSNA